MKRIMIAGVALAAMAPMAWAAEVTAKQAELAAKNWINRDPHRLNASFRSANAEDVATAYGASGRVLYHVVQLTGSGEHRLKWNYVKNGSVTKGEDFGWLDQITWTGK